MPFNTDLLIRWIIRLIVAFTALPIHEFAHGFVADKLGDSTPRYQGRLTLNPFKHLDLIGTACIILTGFGWAKPVQVNPRNFKNPKAGMAITAAAGPLSNLVMAFLAIIVEKVCLYLPIDASLSYNLAFVFELIATVNVSLAVFNLLPVPPLDGSRVLNLFLPQRIYFAIMQYERFILIALFLLLWVGVLDVPLGFLRTWVFNGLVYLTGFVDLIAGAFR